MIATSRQVLTIRRFARRALAFAGRLPWFAFLTTLPGLAILMSPMITTGFAFPFPNETSSGKTLRISAPSRELSPKNPRRRRPAFLCDVAIDVIPFRLNSRRYYIVLISSEKGARWNFLLEAAS